MDRIELYIIRWLIAMLEKEKMELPPDPEREGKMLEEILRCAT